MKEYDLRLVKRNIYSENEDIKYKTIRAENEKEAIEKAAEYLILYELKIGASRYVSDATIKLEDGKYHNLEEIS